jgi:hypothetical protein
LFIAIPRDACIALLGLIIGALPQCSKSIVRRNHRNVIAEQACKKAGAYRRMLRRQRLLGLVRR